jgi:hypothetical protein
MLHTDNGGHRCLGLLRLWCAVGASSITGKKEKEKKKEKKILNKKQKITRKRHKQTQYGEIH